MISPDLIGREFTADPGQRLVGDITYLRTGSGWLYLATVIDLATRMVVGWQTAAHMRTALVTDALGMAITRRRPSPGTSTIMHSDHGSQFTSWAFGQRLQAAGLLGSMGSIGDCYDNSMMESFWAPCSLSYSTHGLGIRAPSLRTRYSSG